MLKIQNDTIVKLLRKVIRKEAITKEEQKTLDDWRTYSSHHQNLFDDVMKEARWENDLKLLLARDEKAAWNNILSKTKESHVSAKVVESKTSWYNYAAAAVLLGAVLTGSIFYLRSGSDKEMVVATTAAEKKSMGRDEERAYLALSDGSTIYLNAAKNGELAREGNSRINKLKDGELVYDAANPALSDQLPLTFNILSTPRATQYKITLPDGSRVWLNAASTLRFPSSFNGEERFVELKGEAYFEIAPSSGVPGRQNSAPFSVKANGMSIDVLGTHFNVMAYREESEMKTSLLQGSVRVTNGANVCMLKPGQQAQVVNDLSLPVRPRRT
ncbi:MAG: FecR domain-containing protein, partial [Chitinophagaceae bacterium]|nr:FecR domain-containing protein [Chitinophagaceae bacterium]